MSRFLSAFLVLTTCCELSAQRVDNSDLEPAKPVAVAIKGTPKLDGKIDEVWKTAPVVEVNQAASGIVQIDEEEMATAKVQFLWDDANVYVLWHVKDSLLSAVEENDPWATDSVEFFLDQNNKASMFYQDDDAQYRVNFKGGLSGQGEGFDESHLKAATSEVDGGYLVEMAVKVTKIKMEAGVKMGIELQVNDDHGSDSRDAAAKWNHTEDDSWEDTSNFGTLELK
ncbi:MAG: sugar-binding protein [Rubripirellula sp.]